MLELIRPWLDAIRRNHALEHATVAVLLARRGPTRLAGRATANGFVIIADLEVEELEDAAREALRRLQAGQASLAVSPLCGTTVAVGAGLSALAATLVLSTGRPWSRLPNAFTAAALAAVAGQPAGRWVQQHVTTLADHGGVEVVGVRTLFGRVHMVQTRGPAGG